MRCVSAKRLIMDWRLDLITTRTRALVDREKKRSRSRFQSFFRLFDGGIYLRY